MFTTSASPDILQECQLEVYTTVKDHCENNNPTLLCIITGLYYRVRLLLGDTLKVSAPTGVAISYRGIIYNTSNKQYLPQDT